MSQPPNPDEAAGAPPPVPPGGPPLLLNEPIGTGETPSSVRESSDLAVLHEHWAALHEPAPIQEHASLKAALTARRWVATAAASEATAEAHLSLIGDLIRAVEALAIRCDELGARMSGLERALSEVVEVLGADLVAVRAELAEGSAGDAVPEVSRGADDG